ncbi:MAG: bifunctional phosphoribosylaminoimidazolecarboxamide formyltransferase/IMP cyclohydrolase [Candidatus Lokiarchaeota archaeon]|nr:bifunctional phosphoribosylaminoimidazolecarboxamide formyltransferase/IMP cyclohydrolase [Candidatus Lokiarchaeota archaeon]
MIKRALVSVFNKTGVLNFVKTLQDEFGIEILSTGGTAKLLQENGIEVIQVSDYTKSPEVFSGRVKTLHPRIEGGILMRRDNESDLKEAVENNIPPIDMVVCNLYPFTNVISKPDVPLETALEMIDIGGPTMIRAAAKTFPFVTVISDPSQFEMILQELRENHGQTTLKTREALAVTVFQKMAFYDSAIANYLISRQHKQPLPEILIRQYQKIQDCRYGENWDQKAAFYRDMEAVLGLSDFKQLHGKELSFNNFLDVDSCVQMLLDLDTKHFVTAILKHTTPNGVAIDYESQLESCKRAFSCDPMSAFGGVWGFNKKLEKSVADYIINEKKIFVEVIIAPEYEESALSILKTKENIRILEFPGFLDRRDEFYARPELRSTLGGVLMQDYDSGPVIKEWDEKTSRKTDEREKEALIFAYKVTKWAKSNSAAFAKEYETGVYTLGIGAGQQSRVHVVKLAIQKAHEFGHDLKNSVMGTDSFFPFPDGPEAAAKAGAKAILTVGGSIRDDVVIQRAEELGISLVFCGKRVFRH